MTAISSLGETGGGGGCCGSPRTPNLLDYPLANQSSVHGIRGSEVAVLQHHVKCGGWSEIDLTAQVCDLTLWGGVLTCEVRMEYVVHRETKQAIITLKKFETE